MLRTSDLLSAGAMLAGMAALTLVERWAPLQRRTRENARHLRVNLPLTLLTFSIYALLSGAVLGAGAATRAAEVGLLAWLPGGPLLETGVTIAGLDLATYLAHRSMHAIPWGWRFHRVHHMDAAVDATTAFRQHPFETIYRSGALALAAGLLGAAPGPILVYRGLSALNAILEHANVRVPARLDTALARVVVTPNMHKIHHSRATPETDSNYGNLFSAYDRLFRSFVPTERAFQVRYGLDGYDGAEMKTLGNVLRLPLGPPRVDANAAEA